MGGQASRVDGAVDAPEPQPGSSHTFCPGGTCLGGRCANRAVLIGKVDFLVDDDDRALLHCRMYLRRDKVGDNDGEDPTILGPDTSFLDNPHVPIRL